jgi:hypothetical protein
VEANRRPALPLSTGRQFESASCGPPFLSAAVAHLCRSAKHYVRALARTGIEEIEARDAFRFTQIAWSRSILSRLEMTFSDDYVIFDLAGKIQKRGKLSEQARFVSAAREAHRYESLSEFQNVATGASEFNAVNKALHGGSKAKNLMMTSVFLFPVEMSEAGLQAARLKIQEEVAVLQMRPRESDTTKPKPWWKFW